MRMSTLAVLGLCMWCLSGATSEGPASQDRGRDVWAPVRGLVGTWEGRSEGKFGPANLVVTWKFVLDGKFLQSTTTSISDDELHEDLGMLSYDKERKRFVYRAFYSEGYVSKFLLSISEDGKTLEFETESVENGFATGLRVKETFVFVGENELSGAGPRRTREQRATDGIRTHDPLDHNQVL